MFKGKYYKRQWDWNLSSRQVGERDLIVKFSDEAAEQEIYL